MVTNEKKYYHFHIYVVSKEINYDDRGGLQYFLTNHPAVDSLGLYKEGDNTLAILSDYPYINTIYIDPYTLGFEASFELIESLRDPKNIYRRICIVLLNRNKEAESLNTFFEKYPSKKHYFKLNYDYDVPHVEASLRLDKSILECQERWFKDFYKHELAVSYCSSDRDLVAPILELLNDKMSRVFYDVNLQDDLVGNNLETKLPVVYGKESRYCVMFISKEYIRRLWPSLERKTVLSRTKHEPGYLIPITIDGTAIPEYVLIPDEEGTANSYNKMVYYNISEGVENIVSMILGKIWVMKPKVFNFFSG